MTDVTPRTASVPGVDSFRRVTFAHTGARHRGLTDSARSTKISRMGRIIRRLKQLRVPSFDRGDHAAGRGFGREPGCARG